jgi:hypothetical protein
VRLSRIHQDDDGSGQGEFMGCRCPVNRGRLMCYLGGKGERSRLSTQKAGRLCFSQSYLMNYYLCAWVVQTVTDVRVYLLGYDG